MLSADPLRLSERPPTGSPLSLRRLFCRSISSKGSFELAQYLVKKKYVDLLGTDLHHEKHLAHLQSRRISDAVKKLLDTGAILNAATADPIRRWLSVTSS